MKPVSLGELSEFIPDGTRLAVPADYGGVAMAAVGPLVERRVQDLHLVCVPTSGIQADVLIAAGAVASIETSAVTLGEAGGAPAFNRAVREGTLALRDATCPAIHAGLMASQKGVPFMPIRGLIGSDILKNRPDWQVIDNPFADTRDPIVVVPAIRPDVALFHAPAADRLGNVLVGRRREVANMAYAAKATVVTVERIVDDLYDDERLAASVLPALYVEAIAVAPRGAAPCGLWGAYEPDLEAMRAWAAAARAGGNLTGAIDEVLQRAPA